ncbi:uncharacterized protein LOC116303521 [Actinia tenebrosa]|uniref:Uncharacterized protein LOC116303521 n=1 Tax=Actinia tenebrosa TaxID=6105 RepID=A0A6P8IPY3_ACTTE|nr:uncharacterized protein LOC116303521 [Actinia tenebrosa]
MADISKQETVESDEQELSKASAKRKYLLVDADLEDLDHELKDNPLSKAYAPMKVFKAGEVKRVAIDKWGSLENIKIEQQKRNERQTNLTEQRENEMRQFWDREETYEPMKKFMDKIDLPKTNLAEEQSADGCKNILSSDVILCFCDCMNSRPPGRFGKMIYKTFPAASDVNKATPYNDRRKMGHFSWSLVNNGDKDQLIVNLYVVHKWTFKSKGQTSFPVLIFGALELALKRLSKLLADEWKKNSQNEFGLSIGTYSPYKVEPEKFNSTLKESFELPVKVFADSAID